MTDRELMQEALYALTYVGDAKEIYSDTIESLRARLAQPEREWQGLTDEEIDWLWGLAFEAKLNNKRNSI